MFLQLVHMKKLLYTSLRRHGFIGRPHLLLSAVDLLAFAPTAGELTLFYVCVLQVEIALEPVLSSAYAFIFQL